MLLCVRVSVRWCAVEIGPLRPVARRRQGPALRGLWARARSLLPVTVPALEGRYAVQPVVLIGLAHRAVAERQVVLRERIAGVSVAVAPFLQRPAAGGRPEVGHAAVGVERPAGRGAVGISQLRAAVGRIVEERRLGRRADQRLIEQPVGVIVPSRRPSRWDRSLRSPANRACSCSSCSWQSRRRSRSLREPVGPVIPPADLAVVRPCRG